jgi:glycosyltransferase involved in cell wall biosynthesis
MTAEAIIHVTEGLGTHLGGTSQFVRLLCSGLTANGLPIQVWSADAGCGTEASVPSETDFLRRFRPAWPPFLQRWPGLRSAFGSDSLRPLLVHVHGLWLDAYRVVSHEARRRGLPLVISLHGMLDPWALDHHPWRKRFAWALYQREGLRAASCLHVATQREAEQVRRLGIETPVAVIRNALPAQTPGAAKPEGAFFDLFPGLRGKRIALFMGRIHPVKGLDLFAQTWAEVCREFSRWHWMIAGPSENGYREQLERMLARLGIADTVTFAGLVEGEKKAALLSACDFLVLPSRSESFGLVALEALQSGKPVLASQGTPWRVLEESGCGWNLPVDSAVWTHTLRSVLGLDRGEMEVMGLKGQQLAKERYAMKNLVDSVSELYGWLTSGGPSPHFVSTPEASVSSNRTRSGHDRDGQRG